MLDAQMLGRVRELIDQREKIDAELESFFTGTGEPQKRKWTRRTPPSQEPTAEQTA
jgi:hypothetical protein